MSTQTDASAEACRRFFTQTQPPEDLRATEERLGGWLARHVTSGRKVALVTSGGTTVPLERCTVRFVDNFSSGTRGAASCEELLSRGFAVVLLGRGSAARPFHRHLSAGVVLGALAGGSSSEDSRLFLDLPTSLKLQPIVTMYQRVTAEQLLFTMAFESLPSYLWQLRMVCQLLQTHSVATPPIVYLAAAVADFFMPYDEMSEHKLDSSDGPLQVLLQPTPKMVRPLVTEWCPAAFVVSFKLETDPRVLTVKATRALQRYGHALVIGNILDTRRTEVVFVSRISRTSAAHTSALVGVVAGTDETNDSPGAHALKTAEIREDGSKCDEVPLMSSPDAPISCIDLNAYVDEFSEYEFLRICKEDDKEIEDPLISEVCRRHQLFMDSRS